MEKNSKTLSRTNKGRKTKKANNIFKECNPQMKAKGVSPVWQKVYEVEKFCLSTLNEN